LRPIRSLASAARSVRPTTSHSYGGLLLEFKSAVVDLRDRIVVEESATVTEFAEFGYPQGSALGLAHTLRQTGPFRPDHRSDAMPGLYYTGSFTAPGIGMPMTLVSGEHTARAVREDAANEGGVLASLGLRSD
jgi:phytoene desaturase